MTIKIYDMLGEEIATLVNETKNPGKYYAQFHGDDFSSGVYLCKMIASDFVSTKKIVLLK